MTKFFKHPLTLHLIVSTILAVCYFYPVVHRGLELQDNSSIYLQAARNISNGHGFSTGCGSDITPIVLWQPGYSVMLSMFIYMGINWYNAMLIIAWLCYSTISLMLYLISRKTGISKTTSLALTAVCLIHPELLRWGASGLSEPLSWVLLLLSFYYIIKLQKKPSYSSAVILGIVFGLGFLTRYAFSIFFAAWLVYLILYYLSHRTSAVVLKYVAVCMAVSISIGACWIFRNYMLTGQSVSLYEHGRNIYNIVFPPIYMHWKIFILKRFGTTAIDLLIILLLPVFAYRLYKNIAATNIRRQFVAFNYLLILFYTLSIIIIRYISYNPEMNSRLFTPLIFCLVFIITDISVPVVRGMVIAYFLIVSTVKLPAVIRYNNGYNYTYSLNSDCIKRAISLSGKYKIYTPDPAPFIMASDTCINNALFSFYGGYVKKKFEKNECIVFLNGLYYSFHNQKRILVMESTYPYKKEVYADGTILFPAMQ